MGTALVPAGQYQAHRRVWRRLVQTARLCCGVPDYDNYVRHMMEKHPEREVMDTRLSSANGRKRVSAAGTDSAAADTNKRLSLIHI